MTLKELKPHQIAVVREIQRDRAEAGFVTRLEAMGILPGKTVRVLRSAILGGPLQVRVGSTTEIAIRRREAELVMLDPTSVV